MGRRHVSVLIAVGLGASALVASTAPAGAATYAVTSSADDGSPGTLRWAVDHAGASLGDDVVEVDPSITDVRLVDCTAGRLEVIQTGSLTIDGNDVVITQTCPGHGVIGGAGPLTLDEVTVTGGTAGGDGGGVSLNGAVTLLRSTVTFNASVGGGGGVAADQVTVVDSTVSDNYSSAGGGGVYARAAARLERSTLASNHAGGGGGARSAGTLAVVDSQIEGNDAAVGAGLLATEAITVQRSTITENRALSGGGGITSDVRITLIDSSVTANRADQVGGVGAPDVSVVDSTIANNAANQIGGLAADRLEITGSAVTGNGVTAYNSAIAIGTSATITRSTVAGNVGPGPVIDTAYLASTSVTLDHATIVGNPGGTGVQLHGPFRSYASVVALNGTSACVFAAGSGEVHSDGSNVSGDTSCGFNNPTDLTGVGDPGLDTLAFHDGPTLNLVPQSGSPLLNRIPVTDPRCTGVDQRGFARPANGGCDVGAVEVRAVSSTDASTATPIDTPVEVDLVPLVTDPDGVLSEYEVGRATSGTVDAADGGVVTYTPDPGFSGDDSYTYVVCSAGNVICTPSAVVSITVGAGPPPPVIVTPRFTG